MAKKENEQKEQDKKNPDPTIELLKKRLELLDQRLDNIDSVVTAVVERVMKQPITLSITCPNCGHSTEIAIVANTKPKR